MTAESPTRDAAPHWFEANPLWFKTAVFYEIHLRGFFDGNNDGSGDFRGGGHHDLVAVVKGVGG